MASRPVEARLVAVLPTTTRPDDNIMIALRLVVTCCANDCTLGLVVDGQNDGEKSNAFAKDTYPNLFLSLTLSIVLNPSVVESSPAAAEADPILRIGSVPDILWSILDFTIIRDSYSDAADATTPLHVASKHGDLGLVIFLVKAAGVNVEEKDRNGETPLFRAVSNRRYETILYLVQKARVDLYAFCNQKWTVLHKEASRWSWEHVSKVKFLVEQCGMKVDTVDGFGRTALHVAVIFSADAMVSWLLTTGGPWT
jgi:Ankyrin repeats (3 copies)/Ankyrin repeats (many copies)